MAVRRAIGTLEPIVFFTDRNGNISLPPTSDVPTPPGWERCYAGTLAEIDALQRRLNDIEHRKAEQEAVHDEQAFALARQRVRDSLYAKMVSSHTSEYEREFIRLYLQLRDEKRAKYQQRLREYTAYLEARENDRPRTADELLGENSHEGGVVNRILTPSGGH